MLFFLIACDNSSRNNSAKDANLKKAMIENNIIKDHSFIPKTNNVLIYDGVLTISYVDMKSLLIELLWKEMEKDSIKDENKKISF